MNSFPLVWWLKCYKSKNVSPISINYHHNASSDQVYFKIILWFIFSGKCSWFVFYFYFFLLVRPQPG